MAYNKHTWTMQELITAEKLNNIEDGLNIGVNLSTYRSIEEFGLIGGEANSQVDSDVIISAIELTSKNNQILYFPAGDYYLAKGLPLLDNLHIEASPDAIFHKLDTSYAFKSHDGKGYGAGGKNIIISGGQWVGNADYSTHLYFNLMHLEDVLFKDMVILRGINNGHVFDTQGCKDVSFKNITFIGMKTTNDRYFTEAIQLDTSTAIGSSNSYDIDTYDGLACENILIEGCKTLPELSNDGTFLTFAPSLVGMHAQTEGSTHHNIKIYDNYIQDANFRPQADSWQTGGSIHLRNAYNVVIQNNTFYRTKPVAHATSEINITIGETVIPQNSISNVDVTYLDAAYEDVYQIKILNNSFTGMYSTSFESDRKDVGIIRINGSTKYQKNLKQVVISGNVFKDTINPANINNNTFNTETQIFYINQVDGISISNNIIDTGFSMGSVSNTIGLIFNDNIMNKVYRTILSLVTTKGKIISNYINVTHGKIEVSTNSNVDIIDNNIYNFSLSNPVSYKSIIAYDTSSFGKIDGNTIDYVGSDPAIYTNSSKVFITNNDVNTISVVNANATGIVINNLTKNANTIISTSVIK